MFTGLAAIDATDWSRLYHAYGRATDAPEKLRLLLNEDAESRRQAMDYLWSAIIHQGTPWTATGPVARVIVGLLFDERMDRGEPIRARLLGFLGGVAEAGTTSGQIGWSVEKLEAMAAFDIEPLIDADDQDALYGEEDAVNSFFARAVLDCLKVTPLIWESMQGGLGHADPRVRALAAEGMATLAKSEPFRHETPTQELQLLALAATAADTDERSAHVMALGDLGASPKNFLNDPAPGVRFCAALAPALGDDHDAQQVLLNALEFHAEEIDDWFKVRPPQFPMRPRFDAIHRLTTQIKDFDRLVAAAVAVVKVTTKGCVDFDWGKLLAAAFPAGDGRITTAAQRKFLAALIDNEELWDPTYGNASLWFRKTGLPYDRNECAKLLAESAG